MISRKRDLHICTAWRLDSRRQDSSTWALLLHRLQKRQPWKVKQLWGLSFMKTHMGVWVLFTGKNLPAIRSTGLSHIQMGVLSLKACSVTVVQLLIQAHFLGLFSDHDTLIPKIENVFMSLCIWYIFICKISVPAVFMVWPCCMRHVWFKLFWGYQTNIFFFGSGSYKLLWFKNKLDHKVIRHC